MKKIKKLTLKELENVATIIEQQTIVGGSDKGYDNRNPWEPYTGGGSNSMSGFSSYTNFTNDFFGDSASQAFLNTPSSSSSGTSESGQNNSNNTASVVVGNGATTVVFDKSSNTITILGNGEPVGIYPAANNVTSSSQGTWPNGTYSVMDTNEPHTHNSGDTYSGSYGVDGIYRADPFEDGNCQRDGMGIHSGRNDIYTTPTNGCIRTTTPGMDAIQCSIDSNGPLTTIIVQD